MIKLGYRFSMEPTNMDGYEDGRKNHDETRYFKIHYPASIFHQPEDNMKVFVCAYVFNGHFRTNLKK